VSNTIQAFPLQWPTGWKRVPAHHRTRAKFGVQKSQTRSYGDGTSYTSKSKESVTIAEARSACSTVSNAWASHARL
jgi:hypothetical protein